jgi:hypothetical protein
MFAMATITPIATSTSAVRIAAPLRRGPSYQDFADAALRSAAKLWFLVAVVGQCVLVAYIVSFYGGSAARGNLAAWNKVLVVGYIPGDKMGNVAIAMHILFAAIITIGGPLQLVPMIRARAPSFHRWTGRIYLLTPPPVFLF